MIKVPFCYKMRGLSEYEDGKEDFGYIKISMKFNKKPSKEDYVELHKGARKLLPIQDEIQLVSIQEYLENTDCDREEKEELLEYLKEM